MVKGGGRVLALPDLNVTTSRHGRCFWPIRARGKSCLSILANPAAILSDPQTSRLGRDKHPIFTADTEAAPKHSLRIPVALGVQQPLVLRAPESTLVIRFRGVRLVHVSARVGCQVAKGLDADVAELRGCIALGCAVQGWPGRRRNWDVFSSAKKELRGGRVNWRDGVNLVWGRSV